MPACCPCHFSLLPTKQIPPENAIAGATFYCSIVANKQAGLSIEGFSIRRFQVNSFLSFWFKKIHEPAKNPFYLVLLTQCILDKCVLFGMEFYAISWILFWPFFLAPIRRTLSEVNGWLLTPVCIIISYRRLVGTRRPVHATINKGGGAA